ncbi:hypothetical protein [Virgibacillus necropolis]|uniref:Uncharacterized protein n=1 Tax=Virgibacillus necropolis TaxID=163877 RepID=A0A221MEX3_9BACI|nr:hypothetical protein [Virgibacillus necropolis]ASN06184.1 hypothetical protein CFK40_14715 [Virgibacillus necropolis]
MLNRMENLQTRITNLHELKTEAQADLEDLYRYINQIEPGYCKDILEQKKELKEQILEDIGAELRYMT